MFILQAEDILWTFQAPLVQVTFKFIYCDFMRELDTVGLDESTKVKPQPYCKWWWYLLYQYSMTDMKCRIIWNLWYMVQSWITPPNSVLMQEKNKKFKQVLQVRKTQQLNSVLRHNRWILFTVMQPTRDSIPQGSVEDWVNCVNTGLCVCVTLSGDQKKKKEKKWYLQKQARYLFTRMHMVSHTNKHAEHKQAIIIPLLQRCSISGD